MNSYVDTDEAENSEIDLKITADAGGRTHYHHMLSAGIPELSNYCNNSESWYYMEVITRIHQFAFNESNYLYQQHIQDPTPLIEVSRGFYNGYVICIY